MQAAEPSGGHAATRTLIQGALRFAVELTDAQLAKFDAYIATLLLWRARLSLTGATTDIAIVRDHILDSLPVAHYVVAGSRTGDLGSGAGFPGVPLAIVRPQASITLVESRRKRANFLREVVRRCNLSNADVMEARAEHLPLQITGTFDVVVSRAVWTVPDFLKIAARLLRSGGLAIAMKGPRAVAEIRQEPGFLQPEKMTYHLQGTVERMLLLYRRH